MQSGGTRRIALWNRSGLLGVAFPGLVTVIILDGGLGSVDLIKSLFHIMTLIGSAIDPTGIVGQTRIWDKGSGYAMLGMVLA
jgi:hypothetical protein